MAYNPKKHITAVATEEGWYRTGKDKTEKRSVSFSMSSCFLNTVNDLLAKHPEYIMIETSGFTKPDTMNRLAHGAVQRSDGALSFGGTICMIDTPHFLNPGGIATLPVYEQVMAADCFILTKTDRTGTETVKRVTSILHHIRQGVPVYTRTDADSSIDTILSDLERIRQNPADSGRRSKSTILIPDGPLNRERLETFLVGIASRFHWIHGLVFIKETNFWIDVELRDDFISLIPLPQGKRDNLCPGLTFVWKSPCMEKKELMAQWTRVTGINGSLIA